MSRPRRISRTETLAGVATVAAATFTGIAVATATRASAHADRTLAPRLALRPRSRGRRVAEALSPVGKWYTIVPAALVGGAMLARERRHRAAGEAIAAASIIAFAVSHAFDRILPQPPVPANHRHDPTKAVFPSGHALMATAVAPTAAYVLSRERLLPASVGAPLAAFFAVSQPALKLAVRKHWPTDVIGGMAAGLTVAAGCCAMYERVRGTSGH